MTTPRRSKQLGKAIEWTDADMERLSTVTPEDIQAASALWRQNAGKLARLLDADTQESIENAKPAPAVNA